MNYKPAYQFDHLGKYLGQTKAQASPLEEGVYLLPASCTFERPPQVGEGQMAVWNGLNWNIEQIPAPEPEPEPEPEPAASLTALDQAEIHVARHFTTPRLLQMKVWLDTFPVEDTPKLRAVYDWTNAITIQAAQGQTTFSEPPHSFEELVAEAIGVLGVTTP